MATFSRTDAWILWSVDTESAGSTLAQIIARADHVNHAIPNREEVEVAISKGLRVGLLVTDGRFVRYAPSRADEVRKVVAKARSAYDSWSELHAFLSGQTWPAICQTAFEIDEELMKSGYSDYVEMLKRKKAPNQSITHNSGASPLRV